MTIRENPQRPPMAQPVRVPPQPHDVDVRENALTRIATIAGCSQWWYPEQIVRDVAALRRRADHPPIPWRLLAVAVATGAIVQAIVMGVIHC